MTSRSLTERAASAFIDGTWRVASGPAIDAVDPSTSASFAQVAAACGYAASLETDDVGRIAAWLNAPPVNGPRFARLLTRPGTPRDLRGVELLRSRFTDLGRGTCDIAGRRSPFGETDWRDDLEASRGVLEQVQEELCERIVLGENRRFVLVMVAGSILGSFIGGRLLGLIPNAYLLPLLAVILVLSAVKVWKHK